MALHLHYFPNSHWSRIISLVIAEKGLSPERHFVDIRVGASFEPEYMRLNPRGVVPTLVDGETVVWDSPRIGEHLDTLAAPALSRTDDAVHAHWMDVLEDFRVMHMSYAVWVLGRKGERSADILADKVTRARAFADEHPDLRAEYLRKAEFFEQFRAEVYDEGYMQRCHEESQATLDAMADALAERPWLGGDTYGFADAIATSALYRLVDLERLADWHDPGNDAPRAAVLRDYYTRLCARPSFAAVFRDDPLIP